MKKALGWIVAIFAILGGCGWLAYVGSSAGPVYAAQLSEWMPTVRLALIGIISITSGFVALRYQTWLERLFQVAVALLGIGFVYLDVVGNPKQLGPFSELPTPSAVVPATCLLVIPGFFWYITGQIGWVALVSRPTSLKFRLGLLLCLLLTTVVSAVSIDFMTIWSGRCHFSEQPSNQPLRPDQAVFTARVIGSGKLWGPNAPSPYWRRYWTLAWVQRQFWGLPWWDSKVVILLTTTRGIGVAPPHGEIDFIDGRRLPGSLTRFLPIFDTFCTRTGSIADAEVDLRVLRDGPPREGVRILGRTFRVIHPNNSDWIRWEPAPAMKVTIRGPVGDTTVESDQHGVYDMVGLPPGYYEISRLPAPGVKPGWRDLECRWTNVEAGGIRECIVLFH